MYNYRSSYNRPGGGSSREDQRTGYILASVVVTILWILSMNTEVFLYCSVWFVFHWLIGLSMLFEDRNGWDGDIPLPPLKEPAPPGEPAYKPCNCIECRTERVLRIKGGE